MEAQDLNKPTDNSEGLNSENQSENTPASNTPKNEVPDTSNEEVTPEKESEEPVSSEATPEEPVKEESATEQDSDKDKDKEEKLTLEPVDHIMLSKQELVKRLKYVLKDFPLENIKEEVEAIKSAFYKKHAAEVEDIKRKFVESGEREENFSAPVDTFEIDLKNLLKEFKARRAEFNKKFEEEKSNNLQAKLEVIEAIKELINKQESLNETFQHFRELQERWRNIGPIPQDKVQDMWETYNHTIENFYAYIKINKELRDLDLKKNMEAKINLCEKAEKLLLEPTIVKAFKTLQKQHEQWREIGPVPRENKEELWERFKTATSQINKRHQEYFESLKEQLHKNLEAKTELCEKAEALSELELHSPKEWEAKSKELIELQTVWKTIGFAPKKDNNKIYERFRSACDKFFNNKRQFFKGYKSEQQHNLQLKTELCIQAEALKESTDWKQTTDEYIKIQKHWKEIGPVPRKQSDAIWKRFRTACDAFFEHKSEFFSKKDESQEENLKLKEAIIEEVKAFEASDNAEENFHKLQDYQHRWNEIGHVPIKEKDRVNHDFRNLINKYFDSLNLNEFEKNVEKFRNKIENYKSANYADERLTQERNKIISKLKQLENDITLWENNIGFFAKSKKSEALVRDFMHKIETGKRNIKLLNKKLDMLEGK